MRRRKALKILVIGNGGREHALTWKIAQSPKVEQIFVAPGNAGTAKIACNLNILANDLNSLEKAAKTNNIDLVVVGPESPLADGIVDQFQKAGIPIFGPNQNAAEIESSKAFAKDLMHKYGIPTAKSVTFSSYQDAKDYVKKQKPPIVVKADGLAAGKGVTVAQSIDEALKALASIMEIRTFGEAGNRVIIEECLTGREMSYLAFTDGKTLAPMVPACDYKRIYDGDKGPNTGGMGSFSPPDFFTPQLAKEANEKIMAPTVKAMAAEGRPI